jgi:hypothetical protein
MPRRTRFVLAPGAEETVTELAAPGLEPAAQAIATAVPEHVPVNQGVARASYSMLLEPATSSREGTPAIRVHVGSPFWHFLEYGTRYNAPYRPVQRAVESLRLRYEPR